MDYSVPNDLLEEFSTGGLLDVTMDDLHVLQNLGSEDLLDENIHQTLSMTGFAQIEPEGMIVNLDEGGNSSAGSSEDTLILPESTESSAWSGQTYSPPEPLHICRVPGNHGRARGRVGGRRQPAVPASGIPANGVSAGGASAGGTPTNAVSAGGAHAGAVHAGVAHAGVAHAGGVHAGGARAGGVSTGGAHAGNGSGNGTRNVNAAASASNVVLPPLADWYDATPDRIAQQYIYGMTPLYEILNTLACHERDAVDATNRLVRLLDRRYQALCPPTHEKFNTHCFAVAWLLEFRRAKQLGSSSDGNNNTIANNNAGGGSNNNNNNMAAATVAVMSSVINADIHLTATAYPLSGEELGQHIQQQEEFYRSTMSADSDTDVPQPPPVPQLPQPPRIPWSMIRNDIVLDREAYQNFVTMVFLFRYMYITMTWKRWCIIRNDTEEAIMSRRYLSEPDMCKLRIWWQEFRRGCEDWERIIFDMRIPTFDDMVREVQEMMADAIDFNA